MEYPLACECGNRLAVTEAAAGTSVSCSCGRALRVPSFRQLRSWDGTTPLLSVTQAPIATAAEPRAKTLDRGPPDPHAAARAAAVWKQAAADHRAAVREAALRNVVIGGLVCAVGIAITAFTYSAAAEGGGRYVIAYGAVIAGAIQFVRGLTQFRP